VSGGGAREEGAPRLRIVEVSRGGEGVKGGGCPGGRQLGKVSFNFFLSWTWRVH